MEISKLNNFINEVSQFDTSKAIAKFVDVFKNILNAQFGVVSKQVTATKTENTKPDSSPSLSAIANLMRLPAGISSSLTSAFRLQTLSAGLAMLEEKKPLLQLTWPETSAPKEMSTKPELQTAEPANRTFTTLGSLQDEQLTLEAKPILFKLDQADLPKFTPFQPEVASKPSSLQTAEPENRTFTTLGSLQDEQLTLESKPILFKLDQADLPKFTPFTREIK